MKTNVGRLDKSVRLLIGISSLVIAVILPGYFKLVSILGVILLATAFIRWCPLYNFLGWSSCQASNMK
jgi:hypothetical protein